jgi:hypothetical protein
MSKKPYHFIKTANSAMPYAVCTRTETVIANFASQGEARARRNELNAAAKETPPKKAKPAKAKKSSHDGSIQSESHVGEDPAVTMDLHQVEAGAAVLPINLPQQMADASDAVAAGVAAHAAKKAKKAKKTMLQQAGHAPAPAEAT